MCAGWFVLRSGASSTAPVSPSDEEASTSAGATRRPPERGPLPLNTPMTAPVPLSVAATMEISVTAIRASSTLPNWQRYTFGTGNLVDGSLATSWQPADKRSGVGAWFQLAYAPARLASFDVANGFQLVDDLGDLFLMNARIVRAELETSSGHRQELAFDANARGWTRFTVGERAPSTWVRVTVQNASAGERFSDLAISEVRVQGVAQ